MRQLGPITEIHLMKATKYPKRHYNIPINQYASKRLGQRASIYPDLTPYELAFG